MSDRVYNVLFLCNRNSARSLIAESVLNRDGDGRFCAFSAGSQPADEVHPMTLEVLSGHHYPTKGLRPKSWNEFTTPDAPAMDFIFTVCDDAAGEVPQAGPVSRYPPTGPSLIPLPASAPIRTACWRFLKLCATRARVLISSRPCRWKPWTRQAF